MNEKVRWGVAISLYTATKSYTLGLQDERQVHQRVCHQCTRNENKKSCYFSPPILAPFTAQYVYITTGQTCCKLRCKTVHPVDLRIRYPVSVGTLLFCFVALFLLSPLKVFLGKKKSEHRICRVQIVTTFTNRVKRYFFILLCPVDRKHFENEVLSILADLEEFIPAFILSNQITVMLTGDQPPISR